MAKKKRNHDGLHNSQIYDSGGKIAFENPTLCSQLLKDYSNLDILKEVRPEDIEDMTERFIPMFSEERNADVVKKVHLPDGEDLFVLSLIEHKADVDFDVVMQMLRYMIFIWEDYAKQAEKEHKGITKTKDFRYPPILPIVYYEGASEWTAVKSFKDRIFMNDVFGKYIPDLEYLLVDIHSLGPDEIMSRKNSLSLLMLINGIRNSKEFKRLDLPKEYLDCIDSDMPEDVRIIFVRVFESILRSINVPEHRINEFTDQIKEARMGKFMEHFNEEGYDWQATRAEALAEGEKRGKEIGKEIGINLYVIRTVRRMLSKGKSVEEIADDLGEGVAYIKEIRDMIERLTQDASDEEIYEGLKRVTVS